MIAATISTTHEEETSRVGARLGACLRAGDIVVLTGDLGTGKTVLVRGLARGLNVADEVASPTFTLIREYAGPTPIFHVDLYRLHPRDVEDLGLEELRERGVTVIEWGEKVPAALHAAILHPPVLRVHLTFQEQESGRTLALSAEGMGPEAAVAAAAEATSSALSPHST